MSAIQKNKEVIRRLYEQSLNQRQLDLLTELVAEDYTSSRGYKGISSFKAPLLTLIAAFPDVQWKLEELIEEGNKVAVRQTIEGTHIHPFQGIKPSGKKVSNTGIAIYELRDGKIISHHIQTDRLGFLQELEVLPSDVTSITIHKDYTDQVNFIDKFTVPVAAKHEFYDRMHINRSIIKTLPGFIEDAVFEHTDGNGYLICITVAKWESQQALDDAKEAVQVEYKKQGFEPTQFLQRLGITMDRAVYIEKNSTN